MLLAVSRRLASTAVLLAFWVAAALAQVAQAQGPTPAEIQAAVSKAESSRQLWATINICNTPRHHNQLGVRGQMPALGFPAALSMKIQIKYFTGTRFRLDPGVRRMVQLGMRTRLLHQDGHTFQFGPHAGLLMGMVTFQWRRGGQLIGQTTRPTTPGHHDADFGDPRGHSAATCRIR